jgi:hypothetical protein
MTANPTPPAGPARVRVEGAVTAVHADGRFALALPDGTERAGTATGSQLRRLGKFLTSNVLVLGVTAPDGTLAADGVLPARGPFVLGKGDTPLSPSEAAEAAARFQSIIGKWPGDETDDQIEQLMTGDR